MRVILAAGGSGGHIFPAISVARELEKMGVSDIFFVSSKRRLDKSLLESEREKCFFLSANPMPLRFNPLRTLVFMFKLFVDAAISVFLIARLRPKVVVGFGGYSSGTIASAAKLFGIPLIVHEQNFLPGRANKILSRFADRVAVSFRESAEYFPQGRTKVVYTGNPIRLDILSNDRTKSASRLGVNPGKLTVLVMGGSQGSSFLNRVVSEAALRVKKKRGDEVQFIHLTGRSDYESIKKFYDDNEIPGRVFSFLTRIDDAYAASDVAVSRSGAAAVFELAYYAKPMILVPYPHPENNQRSNALYFSQGGSAIYREESELTQDGLAGELMDILTDSERRDSLARASGRLSAPGAGRLLAEEIIKLAGGFSKRR